MIKRMSLNDDQFRQIMVGDNSAEYGIETINIMIDRSKMVIKQYPVKHH